MTFFSCQCEVVLDRNNKVEAMTLNLKIITLRNRCDDYAKKNSLGSSIFRLWLSKTMVVFLASNLVYDNANLACSRLKSRQKLLDIFSAMHINWCLETHPLSCTDVIESRNHLM